MNAQEVVRLQYHAITTGDPDAAVASVVPDYINEEAVAEPPACALPGPAGLLAASAWLRFAFPDLEVVEHTSLADADHVLSHVTLRGTHTGPFTQFAEGRLTQVIPPTGRTFAVEQVHLFRVRDGEVVRHAAVRDDLGLLAQIGVFPPTPAVALRIAWWRLTGRAAAAGRAVVAASEEAAVLVAPTGARSSDRTDL